MDAGVPDELRDRVKMWFTFNWENSKTLGYYGDLGVPMVIVVFL